MKKNSKNKKKPVLRHILIIRFSAIGDIVLTTPVIRMIKKTFPETEIDFLVKKEYREILEANPYINEILTLASDDSLLKTAEEIKRNSYNAVVDFQMSLRSFFICFLSGNFFRKRTNLRRLRRFLLVQFKKDFYGDYKTVPLRFLESVKRWNVKDDGSGADFFITDTAHEHVSNKLKNDGIDKADRLIVLAPGAGRNTKKWPAQGYTEVGNYFAANNFKVAVIGGKGDLKTCALVTGRKSKNILNYAGEFNLQQTAALLSAADLLISNDTGVMHIASAVCRNVLAVFGPTTAHLGFKPFRCSSTVIEKEFSCRPCSFHGTYECPGKNFRCMREISSKEVIIAANKLINRD